MGKLGEHGVPLVWKSLKQKVTTISSTSAELIGVSDMFDLLQCAHELAEFIQARQELPFTVYQEHIWVAPRLMQSADSLIFAISGSKST